MHQSITDALKIITGDKGGGYYFAGFFFSILAIILSIYMHSKKRDPKSPNTPVRFSFLFMIWDNFKRAGAGMILMFIIFRVFDCSNVMVMIGVGFFVAFGVDKGIQWLMEKTDFMNFLKTNRENFPQKPADNDTK